MTDISVAWNPTGSTGDWVVADGLLVGGTDLETAVLVSLFTDGLLPADTSPPDGSNDRRGWWADTYREQPIGSLLWTLSRAIKANAPQLLSQAQQICLNALNWMITDGAAATVQVSTTWLTTNQMGIAIQITEPDGTTTTFKYSWAWAGV